jgi:hypothetical protein
MHSIRRAAGALALLCACLATRAQAQLTDYTTAPNVEREGIKKSLSSQVGAGRGDEATPGSSRFIIARDPFRAIRRGRQLFQRKFTLAQGIGPVLGDGVGALGQFNAIGAGLADSCAACHGRPRGAAGFGGDVATRPDSRDAPHLFGLGLVEMLGDEMTQELRALRARAKSEATRTQGAVSLPLIAKGVSFGTIRALPSGRVMTQGVQGVDPDLRVRPFAAHGREFSIRSFVVLAAADELGLEAVDPVLDAAAQGSTVSTAAGLMLRGTEDAVRPAPAASVLVDPDGDGKTNELPGSLVDFLEFYLLNYFKPALYRTDQTYAEGLNQFNQTGCNTCHVRTLTVDRDRRVADVTTVFDASRGIFNGLFATAVKQVDLTVDSATLPPLQRPAGQSFVVENLFSDLKRHDLGPRFWERNFDGTIVKQFVTEPLWGVASTSPYGHDGRSINLNEVILRHGGEAQASRDAYDRLPDLNKEKLQGFLSKLVLFPPDDTASNLDPGDRSDPLFPQRGHGSIKLGVLFNDPAEPE